METDKITHDINFLLNTECWITVKEKFMERIKELENISNIDDTQPIEIQAIQIKANKKTIEIINSVLSEIKALAGIEIKKNKSYV